MSEFTPNFDVTRPMDSVRVLCGLFYIPHVIGKITGYAGTVAFFAKAGFQPPAFFVLLAMVMEAACAIGLILGIGTKYLGVVSAGLMAVAAYAIVATRGLGWFWAGGGIEYLCLWGFLSLAIAADAWKREPGFFGFLARPAHA
jgi:putative oxidoreductase